jgi:hypothetical protein
MRRMKNVFVAVGVVLCLLVILVLMLGPGPTVGRTLHYVQNLF